MKLMTEDMKDAKGTSMLEDYTYNFVKGKEGILQAHMLEVCPTMQRGRSASAASPYLWETGKIRQDWYLPVRRGPELRFP